MYTSNVLLEFDFVLLSTDPFFLNKELIWNVTHSLLEWSRKRTSTCARKYWFFQRSLWQGIFFIPPCVWNSQRHTRGSWFWYPSFWQVWSIQVTFLEILNTLHDFQEILATTISLYNNSIFDFREERAKRVDVRTMDINKFIVRLEKLMNQLPSDPVKRRNHEQKVVPWINEKDVPRCPECAR